ncbi:hypothetical protein TNCV_211001 [Trichonephila clavipes]|uniref:Uncharacterized protein n=1 Tax=Trichonephila clavipes TaxID=2585209 RepID=A0A8X6VS24_TRICX|nr:hypothetical protein TNCV_211001 [Trichonephila clavipes]
MRNLYLKFLVCREHRTQTDTQGSFSCLIIIRHGRCQFAALGKSTDLCRGPTRNLGYRRTEINQLRHPADQMTVRSNGAVCISSSPTREPDFTANISAAPNRPGAGTLKTVPMWPPCQLLTRPDDA